MQVTNNNVATIPADYERAAKFDAINYACGSKPVSGWANVDIFDSSFMSSVGGEMPLGLEEVCSFDLLAPHTIPDATFDWAFAEDFVEHLDLREALLFFNEVYRCLKPGAVFRVATPGLLGVMQKNHRNKDYTGIYGQCELDFIAWGHKHFFCKESLTLVAKGLASPAVTEVRYGESEHARLQGLETRPEQIGTNFYAELTK